MRKWVRKTAAAAALAGCVFLGGCAMGGATGENTVAGIAALEEGNYEEAADLFAKAADDGEVKVLAYRGLGMAYMGLARYEDAEDAFEDALESADKKMPDTVRDIRLYLSSVKYRLGEYEDIEAICQEILSEEDGICVDAYFLRGASLLMQGNEEEARRDFDAAAALSPDDYTLYLNIYECYEEADLSGVGSSYLQSALNIHGDTMEDAYHRGRIYYYLGDYEKAQRELIHPAEEKYEDAMFLMGQVYLALEDYTHARNMYENIRTAFGDSPQCCNGMAMCAMKEKKYDEALQYIQQGLQMDGTAGKQELYFNEMTAYEKKLDFETARQKAQEYAARYPSDERGQKEALFLESR